MDRAPDADTPAVLIVDDEAGVRMFLACALRLQGFAVRQAADGREAVDVYHRERDVITVALVDLQLPDRTGWQVMAALRAINPTLAVCLTGGNVTTDDPRSADADCVLAKPLAIPHLARTLRALHDAARRVALSA